MGDEFDGCECIWSHELAMRRLLSLLRQTQSHCTDTDCIEPTLPTPNNSEDGNFALMTMFTLFAVILYFIRPSAFMGTRNDAHKSSEQPPGGQDPDNGQPPTVN
uniref:Small integral membrane protein 14 n=1 Tax=Tabanus bromius TaxID=304241 RepID=A0A0K8TQD5_TABBR